MDRASEYNTLDAACGSGKADAPSPTLLVVVGTVTSAAKASGGPAVALGRQRRPPLVAAGCLALLACTAWAAAASGPRLWAASARAGAIPTTATTAAASAAAATRQQMRKLTLASEPRGMATAGTGAHGADVGPVVVRTTVAYGAEAKALPRPRFTHHRRQHAHQQQQQGQADAAAAGEPGTSTAVQSYAQAFAAAATAEAHRRPAKQRTGMLVLVMSLAAHVEVQDWLRLSYQQYGGTVTSGDVTMPFTYFFVIPSPNGTHWVEGDLFYTKGKPGYLDQPAKTRFMLRELEDLYDYDYIFRTDDDTFVCLNRVLSKVLTVPEERRPRIWGGHLTTDKWVVQQPDNKWYDKRALELTRIKQYPPYMEGNGYLLGRQLVRDFLEVDKVAIIPTDMEDTSIAVPMTILDKTILQWALNKEDCKCALKAKGKHTRATAAAELWAERDTVGYHNCKSPESLAGCNAYLPAC